MTFTKKSANTVPIADTVFKVVLKAREDRKKNGDAVIDATLGALFDEDGKFVTLKTVFRHYDEISPEVKGAYAADFTGNPGYREEVYRWVSGPADLSLAHSVIASPGGSGSVSSCFDAFLDPGETIILPEIGWVSYQLMAMQYHLKVRNYELFENDKFAINSLKEAVRDVMKTQDRVVLVLNDPCHNPTGYSLSYEEWQELVLFLNEVSEQVPVILIDDIAYIDYSYNLKNSRNYMSCFNGFTDNVMAVIAFSCSKSLTSYGLRCGASIVLAQKEEDVREAEIVLEKTARSIWSNIPNAAMENFAWVVTEAKEPYLEEKEKYINLLKQRSDIFLAEAKACALPIYPYKEGFFITVIVDDNKRVERIHEELMRRHIYTVTVNKGIRVAICSLPIRKVTGLAKKIKEVLDTTE